MSQSKSTQSFGSHGEQLARHFLERSSYRIVAFNWRCALGEIDIIAEKDNILVFVEVRSRHAETTEQPFESINQIKKNKLIRLAHQYIADHDLDHMTWRIDVIAIAIPRSGLPIIEHIEDALDW